MQIFRDIGALRSARGDGPLALVPTMGALHDGHLALIADGKRRAGRVLATIFVNPLQFDDPADLSRYPRQEAADLAKLEAAACDAVWLPTPDDLYPAGFATTISVRGISERWEGAHRPGHFDGVATVVAKLLVAAAPSVAIFGEKDWQQLAVIRRMVTDLGLPVAIAGHPIVRDADGLAMSSRNALLNADERADAVALPRALAAAAARIAAGDAVAAACAGAVDALIAKNFSTPDYLALVDGETLEPLEKATDNARLLVAARLGRVRLIDNMPVTSEPQVSR